MIRVQLTDHLKQLAKAMERATLDKLKELGKALNYTELDEPEQFYYGALGELAFVSMLRQQGIQASYQPLQNGVADECDVTVWHEQQPVTLDIKTASKAHYKYLMTPAVQVARADRYVGVKIDGNEAVIYGVASRHQLRPHQDYGVKAKIPTLCLPLDELTPIEEVNAYLTKGQTQINIPEKVVEIWQKSIVKTVE